MSQGYTPYEFVQQVFYVQEKVLLDFHPDDDVYKEVLMDANHCLQELQKEEDWLWLRGTENLGFVTNQPFFQRREKDWHWSRRQHSNGYLIPDTVYKPSELYGDGVRLCRYRIRHELVGPYIAQQIGWKRAWEEIMKKGSFKADRSFIQNGEIEDPSMEIETYEYGGSFPFELHTLPIEDLPRYIDRGKWYLDIDGYLWAGDIEVEKEDVYGHLYSETPNIIYMKYPIEAEPVMPGDFRVEEFVLNVEPAPHNSWELWHNHRYWDHWFKHRPHLPEGLMILWDEERDDFWNWIEVFDNDYIKVPYMSAGQMHRFQVRQDNAILQPQMISPELGAVVLGNKLTFTRPLTPWESHRVILMDVQRRIEPFHICNDDCVSVLSAMSNVKSRPEYPADPCYIVHDQTEKRMLTEIPDPLYVVYRTAALHAQGSPSAQARIMDITDNAQKLLSAMRANNSEFTAPDLVDWFPWDYVNVI